MNTAKAEFISLTLFVGQSHNKKITDEKDLNRFDFY